MGAGCTSSSSTETADQYANERKRNQRMGNFTFQVYGISYSEGKYVGEGCKRTPAWETQATREHVLKKREEFWSSQVHGSSEVWAILKGACEESDVQQIAAIIDAAGLRMANGVLMQVFDETGHRYDIPPYVINEAVRYGKEAAIPDLPKNFKAEELDLVIRSIGPDFNIKIENAKTVQELKDDIGREKQLSPGRLRLFYGGKELVDGYRLALTNVKSGVVIQAMVRPEPT